MPWAKKHGLGPKRQYQRAYVNQGYAGYLLKPSSKMIRKRKYITTSGLATCVGLAAYHRGSKSGLVAHFDSGHLAAATPITQYLINHLYLNNASPDEVLVLVPSPPDDSTKKLQERLAEGVDSSEANVSPSVQELGGIADVYLDLSNGNVGYYWEGFNASTAYVASDPSNLQSRVHKSHHAGFGLFKLALPVICIK